MSELKALELIHFYKTDSGFDIVVDPFSAILLDGSVFNYSGGTSSIGPNLVRYLAVDSSTGDIELFETLPGEISGQSPRVFLSKITTNGWQVRHLQELINTPFVVDKNHILDTYEFIKVGAGTQWDMPHGRGVTPKSSMLWVDDVQSFGRLEHVDDNNARFRFETPVSGKAILLF